MNTGGVAEPVKGRCDMTQSNKPKAGWYFVHHNKLLTAVRAGDLTATEGMVLTMLASYANYTTGKGARPGNSRLANDCHVSLATVGRALTKARRLGLIKQTRKGFNNGAVSRASEFTMAHEELDESSMAHSMAHGMAHETPTTEHDRAVPSENTKSQKEHGSRGSHAGRRIKPKFRKPSSDVIPLRSPDPIQDDTSDLDWEGLSPDNLWSLEDF